MSDIIFHLVDILEDNSLLFWCVHVCASILLLLCLRLVQRYLLKIKVTHFRAYRTNLKMINGFSVKILYSTIEFFLRDA